MSDLVVVITALVAYKVEEGEKIYGQPESFEGEKPKFLSTIFFVFSLQHPSPLEFVSI